MNQNTKSTETADHNAASTAHGRLTRPSTTRGLFSWALYDWANTAYPIIIQTFVFAAFFTGAVVGDEERGTALWGYAVAAAGLLTAFTAPVLGAAADNMGRRKPWLAVFTGLAIVVSASLYFIKPDPSYTLLALVLVGIGAIVFEYAGVFYNAMLPDLASKERVGRWSGWGWAMGYFGGVVCLVIAYFGLVKSGAWLPLPTAEKENVRATFPLVAGWFFLFALPLFLFTPDVVGTGKNLKSAFRDGLSQLGQSIRSVRQYGHIVRFLIARMVYVDGLATIFAFGGIYAKGTFKMTDEDILLFGIGMNITAGIGAAVLARVDDWLGSKRTVLTSLVCLFILMAILVFVHDLTLFWIFALLLSAFVGPVQAASRSYLSHMSPENLRNQMFGLYAFSGKATSFLGPLLVATITDWTNSQRAGMSSVLLFLLVGFILMLSVPSTKKNPLATD